MFAPLTVPCTITMSPVAMLDMLEVVPLFMTSAFVASTVYVIPAVPAVLDAYGLIRAVTVRKLPFTDATVPTIPGGLPPGIPKRPPWPFGIPCANAGRTNAKLAKNPAATTSGRYLFLCMDL
jgi:hypothetical protein